MYVLLKWVTERLVENLQISSVSDIPLLMSSILGSFGIDSLDYHQRTIPYIIDVLASGISNLSTFNPESIALLIPRNHLSVMFNLGVNGL